LHDTALRNIFKKKEDLSNLAMPTRTSPSTRPGPDTLKPKNLDRTEGKLDNPPNNTESVETPNDCGIKHSADSASGSVPNNFAGSLKDRVLAPDVSTALTYCLELVRYGAMLVAVEGRPQIANRAALAILEKKDGLWLSNHGLVAERASDTRLLLKLLREAIQLPEKGEPSDSPLTLPRTGTRSALIVRVVPGPGLDCWPSAENRAAMVMLYDQDMGVEVDVSLLIKLYGLTRGEAALAANLMRGKSIEEAAEGLFISPHTARTHLKRIFMKTDTHRQTELVVRTFPAVL
jgi:DNA-binding CsgD family transcriptional regulator